MSVCEIVEGEGGAFGEILLLQEGMHFLPCVTHLVFVPHFFQRPTCAPPREGTGPPSAPQMSLWRPGGGYRRVGRHGKRGGRRGEGEPGGVLASPPLLGFARLESPGGRRGSPRRRSAAAPQERRRRWCIVGWGRRWSPRGQQPWREELAGPSGAAAQTISRGRPSGRAAEPPKGKNTCFLDCLFLFLLLSS